MKSGNQLPERKTIQAITITSTTIRQYTRTKWWKMSIQSITVIQTALAKVLDGRATLTITLHRRDRMTVMQVFDQIHRILCYKRVSSTGDLHKIAPLKIPITLTEPHAHSGVSIIRAKTLNARSAQQYIRKILESWGQSQLILCHTTLQGSLSV